MFETESYVFLCTLEFLNKTYRSTMKQVGLENDIENAFLLKN